MAKVTRSLTARLVFSANGGYNWREDRRIGRDWDRWAHSGLLDYYAPQVDVILIDEFKTRLATTISELFPDCPVYAGLGFKWSGGKNTVAEIVRQIEGARELGAAGLILFCAGSFTDELYKELATGPFRTPVRPLMHQGYQESK